MFKKILSLSIIALMLLSAIGIANADYYEGPGYESTFNLCKGAWRGHVYVYDINEQSYKIEHTLYDKYVDGCYSRTRKFTIPDTAKGHTLYFKLTRTDEPTVEGYIYNYLWGEPVIINSGWGTDQDPDGNGWMNIGYHGRWSSNGNTALWQ
ncbi:MAG: hypothetical protein LBT66_04615 [Methanobrevibacter sp.]|nr:hypothetical protein [Candidatus Methanovirga meridionalis]